jgi:hypothetical protein
MATPTTLAELLDVEAIKQLKARYCLLLDLKHWDEWRALFTEDARFEGIPYPPDISRDDFVARLSARLEPLTTIHQVHNGAVELTGPTTARGLWAMFDDLEGKEQPENDEFPRRFGYGYYEEEYRKDGGEWRIAFLRLTRIRVDRVAWQSQPVEVSVAPLGTAWLRGEPR